MTSETNADNKTTSYAYDLMSNLTGVTDALNRTTNYTYDNFNRLTKIKYPEATPGAGRLEENFTYDLVGNLVTKTDQAGRVTTFCYDNVNRLTSTIDPAQKTTAFEYNARSQITAVVDAINQRYEFVYDALGRRTQEKKGTATMSLVYDAAGNRSQRTDYNNAVTNYSYDALNRLTTISYPDTTSATYGYDVLSRLTTATNPTGTVTIAYDNRSRVSSVSDVFGQVVSYSYDANSNRTLLSLNSATNATYQYDAINRLTQLTDAASLNTTFVYDATNKLTSRTLPNGVVSTHQYDGLDRLTRLTHAKAGNTLADFQYQLDAASNITQMIDGAGTHNFTYDTRDRLTAVTHPVASNESYTLDDVGNRTASHQGSSYTYQTFNRLTSANSNSYGHDANGNLTSKTDASGSWTYTWDYENRLKQVSKSGGVIVTYSYDALGRRIQRTSSLSGTTRFVYDGDDVIRDLDGSGATVADYLNGPGVDNKLRQIVGGNTSYFVTDHLGTTRALADSSGTVTSSVSYDAYGNLSSGSVATRYTYTGRESDAETGLMYYRARWYDFGQGRFISEDPIGLDGGINLFGYVANNPVGFSDPSGLCMQDAGAGVIGRLMDLVDKNYEKCKHLASIPIDAAKAILVTSMIEKVDPTLLSVTWRHESGFQFYPDHNYRREAGQFDVGPMQVSTTYYDKPKFTQGLPDAFGRGPDELGRPIFGKSPFFNGNPYSSLRVGARAFTRDILQRAKSNADAAGMFRGPAGYQQRYNEYVQESPGDRRFFNCLQDLPY